MKDIRVNEEADEFIKHLKNIFKLIQEADEKEKSIKRAIEYIRQRDKEIL